MTTAAVATIADATTRAAMPPSPGPLETPLESSPRVLDAHRRYAQAVRFTRDGRTLLTAGRDASVRLWRLPDFTCTGSYNGHARTVSSIELAPGDRAIATGSTDGTVRVWDHPSGRVRHILAHQTWGTFSPDGRTIATISNRSDADSRGSIVLWDAGTGGALSEHQIVGEPARIAYLDNRTLLVASSGDVHVVRLDTHGTEPVIETHGGHQVSTNDMAISPDRRLLATTGSEGALRLRNTSDWSVHCIQGLGTDGTFQIAFAPHEPLIAITVDKQVLLYTIDAGGCTLSHRLGLPVKGVYGVAFSPRGRYLAVAAADGQVRVWPRN